MPLHKNPRTCTSNYLPKTQFLRHKSLFLSLRLRLFHATQLSTLNLGTYFFSSSRFLVRRELNFIPITFACIFSSCPFSYRWAFLNLHLCLMQGWGDKWLHALLVIRWAVFLLLLLFISLSFTSCPGLWRLNMWRSSKYSHVVFSYYKD